MSKPQPLSEESRKLAAAIARDLDRVLNRVEYVGGSHQQPSKDAQLYRILRKLQAIAGGAPTVIEGEYPEIIRDRLKGPSEVL